jgi:adenylate cyclase
MTSLPLSQTIPTWVTEAGLGGMGELELLCGFCERLNAGGVPLSRALVIIDTLHPIHEGRAFRWRRDESDQNAVIEYGRTNEGGENEDNWRRSPFYRLVETGESSLRRNIARGDPADFGIIRDHAEQGQTDYLAMIHRFAADGVIGEMDCIYSAWTSDAPGGFDDAHIGLLSRLAPPLMLALKCASLARIAGTLVETYLGRDAGRRVISGRIARGVADRIGTVIWFSDLRGFTRITDGSVPEEIIPLLNDYAEAIISAIHNAGGDVLKLIGDGTLAIFHAQDRGEACRCALKAVRLAGQQIAALNERRAAAGLPLTQPYLGLHVGEVFYGNIGSHDRLDFTVVGPAVNEASRIAAMCRSVERDVLVSSAFAAAALPEDREQLLSVGRYALRGVGQPQELFTLFPDDI